MCLKTCKNLETFDFYLKVFFNKVCEPPQIKLKPIWVKTTGMPESL